MVTPISEHRLSIPEYEREEQPDTTEGKKERTRNEEMGKDVVERECDDVTGA